MTLPTRDELIEKMVAASRRVSDSSVCKALCDGPHKHMVRCICREQADAALTAIESVIPVSGILSGEYVVRLGTPPICTGVTIEGEIETFPDGTFRFIK